MSILDKFKFFSDKTINHNYLLIKLIDYINPRYKPIIDIKKEVIIDVGVYDLKKNNNYSWINKINFKKILDNLPDNHFIPFDYPSDMCNQTSIYKSFIQLGKIESFILRSYENSCKYCYSKNFIVSIQYKPNNILDFKYMFDKFNCLIVNNNILALGNMCRIQKLSKFMKESIKYSFKNSNSKRIHIFGLTLRAFKYCFKLAIKYDIELSIDSTNWTRACNKYLKTTFGLCCIKKTRQLYFNEYLKSIELKKQFVIDNL